MITIAEISIPADEFALHETLTDVPDAEFEVQSVAAHDQDRVIPYLWATSHPF